MPPTGNRRTSSGSKTRVSRRQQLAGGIFSRAKTKTARLTPLEHGVYGLLLDEFYATEGPLPLDSGEIANVVGARTDADEAAVQKVLGRYFTETDAGWVNSRALEEMDSTRKFSAAQKARIDKRWTGKYHGDTETVPDGYPGMRNNRLITT